MYIKSRQGSEVLRTNYSVTDDINGVPTIETNELQLKDFHDTPIKMLSPSLIDEFVLVIKDEAAASDSSLMKMIGVHRFIYDMNLSRVYDEYTQYFSIENILGLIFDGTEYTFEVKGDKTYYALMFENFGDKDKMSLIQQICSRWEVEYHISGTHVVFGDRRGSLTGNMFRYKMNILDSNINLDISKGATYILGKFGKKAEEEGDEDTYVEKEFLHPLAEQYGKRDADPYSNENITQESTMTEYLKRKIEETWILSIEVEVSDLKGNGQVNVGDTVWAIDERLNIEMQTRVIKLVRYYDINDRVYKTKVTLGNYNFIDSVSNTDQTATDVLDKVVATNKKIESQMADFDNRFNKSRDEIIKEINDEFERQREEVEADFDAWKLYEEQARENIQQSVDGIVGDMASIDTTIEEWQNTASSRFNSIESTLGGKISLSDLAPLENRLEASEHGISALFRRLPETVNLVYDSEKVRSFDGKANQIIERSTEKYNLEEYDSLKTLLISFDFVLRNFDSPDLSPRIELIAEGVNGTTYHNIPVTYSIGEVQNIVLEIPQKIDEFKIGSHRLTAHRSAAGDVSNVMAELKQSGQTEPSPYEPHIDEQSNVDLTDIYSRLEVNEENLDLIFGRVEGNETDIANFQMTADGLSSSVGTLRSDLDDMEQWSLAAGSDWQQTKDGFDRYVVANNETVDGLRTDVSNVVERADGISSTVSSMRGDVDDLEAWRADAGSQWEQTSQAITGRVWLGDMGGNNLIPYSSLPKEVDHWRNSGTGVLIYGNHSTLGLTDFLWVNNMSANADGIVATNSPPLIENVVAGETYAVSFKSAHRVNVYEDFRYLYLINETPNSDNQSLSGVQSVEVGKNGYNGNPILLHTVIFTANFSGKAHIRFGTRAIEGGKNARFYITEPKLEKGGKVTGYSPSPNDFLQHTDFRLQADGFFLGTTFVGGSHYATAIVGDASGLKLIGDKISIDGNLDVLGKIRSEAINSVYANISEVRTRILIANSIKVNMLDVTTTMAEKFYTHAAFINNASIKAANIRDLDAIKINANQITSGILQSSNGNYHQNLNSGITDYFGFASIRFNSVNNFLSYAHRGKVGWLGFQLDTTFGDPAISVGVNYSSEVKNSTDFAGFRAFAGTKQAEVLAPEFVVNAKTLFQKDIEVLKSNMKFVGGELIVSEFNKMEVITTTNGATIQSKNLSYGIEIRDSGLWLKYKGGRYDVGAILRGATFNV